MVQALTGSAGQLLILEAETDGFGHCLIVAVGEHAHFERLAITCDVKQLTRVNGLKYFFDR
jgi:hypothetical protein